MSNIVIVTGRFSRTPTLFESETGTKYIKFKLIDGSNKKNAIYFHCVAFGKKADLIVRKFKKGDLAFLQGYLLNSYQCIDDKKAYGNIICVYDLKLLSQSHKDENEESVIDIPFAPLTEELPIDIKDILK